MRAPIRLRVSPSRVLTAMLGAAHVAALATVTVTTLPAWAKLLVASMVATSCVRSILHTALLRTAQAIVELEVGEGRRVAWRSHAGVREEGRLLDSSFVTPWLTVLNLQAPGARIARHVVIVPDNAEPNAFRRLRVWLRWAPPASANNRG